MVKDDVVHFEIIVNPRHGVAQGGTSGSLVTLPPVPLTLHDGQANLNNVVACAVNQRCTINIAEAAKHLCPSTLAEQLGLWKGGAEVLITHLKPTDSELTIREVLELDHLHPIRRLLQGEIIEF